jgi:tetratricopeptide (TPR) repeat protein
MGQNAVAFTEADEDEDGDPFGRRSRGPGPARLTPPPDECFRRSLELAPNQRDTYEALFHYHLKHKQRAKAEKVGSQLLEHFPDHVPTLVGLGELRLKHGKYAEAIALFHRAARANPLDRGMRERISTAHLFKARAHAEESEFDPARADFEAALALHTGKDDSHIYCKWAACEFKAANSERAEELLRQAHTQAGNRLAVAYSMLIEAIRLKLPRPLKSRFDQDFNEALTEPPTGAGAAAIADTAALHRLANVTYTGQKTHETKVTRKLARAKKVEFTEEQLARVCKGLVVLESSRVLIDFAHLGQKRFPDNPTFYLVEADALMSRGPSRCPTWQVEELLKNARQRIEGLPPDKTREEVLKGIQERLDTLMAWNPFAAVFARGAEGLFGGLDEFEDDDGFM